ncbi:MAG: DUF1294 domain-containing protein [Phenylobacterium sp.]|nr:DUF1294 domain-containing protein [Phenylobacterium sp.]
MWVAIAALIALNIAAFVSFGADKARAERERQRLPEWHLLTMALFGGAAGAIAGQYFFRHKTRKQPFRTLLIGAAVVNLAVAALVLSPEVRAYVAGLFV